MEPEQPKSKRLLIIDDEPSFLILLRRIFQKSGYEIITSENGTQAKNIIENQGCDLIITDKNLPDISGMEILKLAKEANPITEVIILTGYDSKETMIEAIDHSAYAYLLKAEAMDNIRSIQNRVRAAFEKQDVILENQRLLTHLSESNAKLSLSLIKRDELEEKLVQSEKMAAVGHFSAGISHELTPPLQGIYSLAQSIYSAPDLDIAKSYAQDIIFHTDEVHSVIKEMKSFINIENRKLSTSIDESIDAALAVCASSELMQNVVIKSSGSMGIYLAVEETELMQIFLNLITNALEAINKKFNGSQGGELTIEIKETQRDIKINVTDNGNGIRKEDITLLFDPRFSTKKSGTAKVGLGLNVTYRLLLKYYGKIEVQSDIEKGSSFSITIPKSKSL
jgi:signal transduction histidine kinase